MSGHSKWSKIKRQKEVVDANKGKEFGKFSSLIMGLTDNKNRTSAEIKHLLTKNSASIAPPGAASWAFEKKDDGWFPKTPTILSAEDLERLTILIAELEENDDVQSVYSSAQ